MISRLLTIAFTTFIETIRQPIYSVILVATAIMLIINVGLAAFTLADDDKLLLDLGLSTLLLSGLFLAAFSAAGVLGREISNKTVLSTISKPVGRPVFMLGKFVGLIAAILVAYYLCFLVFVLTCRHGVLQTSRDPWDAPVLAFGFGGVFVSILGAAFCNYFYGKDFPTSAIAILAPVLTVATLLVGFFDEKWEVIPFGSNYIAGQIIIAAYLVLLVIIVMASVALAASSRAGQLMTLLISTIVLALGIAADYVFGRYDDPGLFMDLAYRITPNVGPFWIIDGLASGTTATSVTFDYVGYVTAYAALLSLGILSLGIALFQRREVG